MVLEMFKSSKDWLNQEEAKLNINENTATLSTRATTGTSETTTVVIKFIKEDGWKIDTLSKKIKTDNSETSEALFE